MGVQTPIYDFLINYKKTDKVSFHMPGHKESDLFIRYGYGEFLKDLMDYDITEIYGADNLYHAETIIKEGQERYAKLYGSKESFYLINGTTAGILAAILSSVKRGGQLIMARNSHKAVFNALRLGDIQPVYIYPEIIEGFNISGAIEPKEIENTILNNPEAQAVILPSPNYYGVCSDIKSIADMVHRYNKILIVDEAHGAHLKFSDKLPAAAIDSGADIVINSIHKTLASFTQSAVLHVNSERVDIENLKDKLQLVQSTSPSYLLMASLDICAGIMHQDGEKLVDQLADNIDLFYDKVQDIEGLKVMKSEDIGCRFDKTKINIDLTQIGLTGSQVDRLLREEHNIYMELVSTNLVMALTGIGNSKGDFEQLAEALLKIKEKHGTNKRIHTPEIFFEKPEQMALPIETLEQHKEWVPLDASIGSVCATSVIPYPPGIPLICPGERISEKAVEYLKALENTEIKILGLNSKGEIQRVW